MDKYGKLEVYLDFYLISVHDVERFWPSCGDCDTGISQALVIGTDAMAILSVILVTPRHIEFLILKKTLKDLVI